MLIKTDAKGIARILEDLLDSGTLTFGELRSGVHLQFSLDSLSHGELWVRLNKRQAKILQKVAFEQDAAARYAPVGDK